MAVTTIRYRCTTCGKIQRGGPANRWCQQDGCEGELRRLHGSRRGKTKRAR